MSPLIDPVMNPAFAGDVFSIDRIEAVSQVLDVICRTTGLGFSAVARVTESHWVACAVRDESGFGLKSGGTLQVETTICNEIRQSGRSIAIDHAEQDNVFSVHPAPRMYGFQSYISVPICLSGGRFFGTLCANDPKATRVSTPETIGMFTLFADLIGQYLDSQERMRANEAALLNEWEAERAREQVIDVLGHDIRNPLSAINGGVEVLRMCPSKEDTAHVLDIIQKSTVRLNGLISEALNCVKSSPKAARHKPSSKS